MTPKTIAAGQVEPVRIGIQGGNRPVAAAGDDIVRPPRVKDGAGSRSRRIDSLVVLRPEYAHAECLPAGQTELLGLLLDVLVVQLGALLGRVRPEPTATVICSSEGPLTGDRNSSAGPACSPSM